MDSDLALALLVRPRHQLNAFHVHAQDTIFPTTNLLLLEITFNTYTGLDMTIQPGT